MLLYILVCSIIYLILAILGIILIIREEKKTNNKEDITLIIISFLVPFIGLIIYAVNVGKDKHITECALKGLKMYLKFLIGELIISVIAVLLMVIVFSVNMRHHTSARVNSSTATKELDTQEIVNKLQSNSYLSSANIKVLGKVIYIDIKTHNNTTKELAKSIAEDTIYYFDNSYREEYDFSFNITLNSTSASFQGYKSYKSKNVIWNE